MKRNRKALAAAFATAGVVTLGGVVLFYRPVAEADGGPDAILSAPLVLLTCVGLCLALFHWLAVEMSSAR